MIGLLVVAFFMVLLPLLYLGLIGLLGFGLYYHAVNHAEILSPNGPGAGRAAFARFILYVGPLVIGALAIVFMIKPLFSRFRDEEEPLTLVRSQEPTLFALLDKLCEQLGAPVPREVVVDVSLNAGAGWRRGLVSLLGRDFRLHIGMSLAAGLTANEFVCVLAHELGHCSQGLAMRLTYIIDRINGWFGRVVYERDQWDDNLVEWCEATDGKIASIFYMTRAMVWITRRVLWVMMIIARIISCGMSRQMEFDADRRSAEVVGDEVTASMLMRLNALEFIYGLVHRELRLAWQSNRLADSLPMFVAIRANEMPAALRAEIEESLKKERTGLFSTHPAILRRVRRVKARPMPPVFDLDAPARLLFGNFKMVGNAVTLTHYKEAHGLPVRANNLVPTEDLAAEHTSEFERSEAVERYFQGMLDAVPSFRLELELLRPLSNPKEALLMLRKVRQRFEVSLPEWQTIIKAYGTVHFDRFRYRAAHAVIRAGFTRLNRKSWNIDFTTREEIEAELGRIGQVLGSMNEKIDGMHKVLRARMTLALRLLLVPSVAAKYPNCQSVTEDVRKWLKAMVTVEKVLTLRREMSEDLFLLSMLLEVHSGSDDDDSNPHTLNATIRTFSDAVAARLEDILSYLELEPYPFDHAASGVTMSRYVLSDFRRMARPVDIASQAVAAADRIALLHQQLLGRLAVVAEKVEKMAGLKPLPAPADPSKAADAGEESATA